MRCYPQPHPFYCGIDVQARTLYVCILNQEGESLCHRPVQASPEAFLKLLAPSRAGIGSAVECMFTWDWLAALCAQQDIPCVLGHALSMQALHGGKAQNDRIDAPTIAVLLRGGLRPQAAASPAAMRATRALWRRRMPRRRQRAELLTHRHKYH